MEIFILIKLFDKLLKMVFFIFSKQHYLFEAVFLSSENFFFYMKKTKITKY